MYTHMHGLDWCAYENIEGNNEANAKDHNRKGA